MVENRGYFIEKNTNIIAVKKNVGFLFGGHLNSFFFIDDAVNLKLGHSRSIKIKKTKQIVKLIKVCLILKLFNITLKKNTSKIIQNAWFCNFRI